MNLLMPENSHYVLKDCDCCRDKNGLLQHAAASDLLSCVVSNENVSTVCRYTLSASVCAILRGESRYLCVRVLLC